MKLIYVVMYKKNARTKKIIGTQYGVQRFNKGIYNGKNLFQV